MVKHNDEDDDDDDIHQLSYSLIDWIVAMLGISHMYYIF